MPFPVSNAGEGSGGGLLLRTPADEFAHANRAGAQAARDTAITNVPAELAQFDGNPNLAIILTVTGTDPDTTVYQVRRGGAWADVTNVVRGPGPTAQQVTAGVEAGVKPYARAGGPLPGDGDIAAEIARDAEVAAAIANLRNGVKAAYDTLKELADKVVTGVAVRNGRIVLTHDDGSETSADATGLARTDAQINALIQAAITAAGGAGGGGGVSVAQALAAILAGSGVSIDRSQAGQITISASGGAPLSLDVFVADNDTLVQVGDATVYRSVTGDFDVQVSVPRGQRYGFRLPAGRTLVAVYSQNGGPETASFAVDPTDPRRYVLTGPLTTRGPDRPSNVRRLIRTAAAGG